MASIVANSRLFNITQCRSPITAASALSVSARRHNTSSSVVSVVSHSPSRLFSVHSLSSMDELRSKVSEATSNEQLSVIEWKATWCGKCAVLGKEIDRLSTLHPNVQFLFADIDRGDLKRGKKEAGIDHLPVTHFIHNGELVHQFTGVRINELANTIEKYEHAHKQTETGSNNERQTEKEQERTTAKH